MGPLGFSAPLLLWGLLALPLLWILLRALPPQPLRVRFAAVGLLLGLRDEERQADKTPWWLLLLRALALAGLIIGFAGPILHPDAIERGEGPLLLAFDATWADAPDWAARQSRANEILTQAAQEGRPAAVVALSADPQPITFQTADVALGRLGALEPSAWQNADLALWAAELPDQAFDTIWFSDGLQGQGRQALATALAQKGRLQVVEGGQPLYALAPARFSDGLIHLRLDRLAATGPAEVALLARGPDPAGIERDLARDIFRFDSSSLRSEITLDLPPELRNRITRFELSGQRSAGAVTLSDDSLKRRKVALVAGGAAAEGLQLLSAQHYLRQAFDPIAELIEGPIEDLLPAAPDVLVLADVAWLSDLEEEALIDWVEKGGLLLRFAGPRMAAAQADMTYQDPLLPVALRQGGRQVGGSLSWGEPKRLAPFGPQSLFYGLEIPDDFQVSEQVLAQPDPELAARSLAALEDGTPLVTRSTLGQGQLVLFHVTANAEWSNLPLSGLFVQMLERLSQSAGDALAGGEAAGLSGQSWQAERLLEAWGTLRDGSAQAGLSGELLQQALQNGPSAAVPPGLYEGPERIVALNVVGQDFTLRPAVWPRGSEVLPLKDQPARPLQGPILAIAMLLLMIDMIASLALAGRLGSGRLRSNGLALLPLLLLGTMAPSELYADEARAIEATSGVVLGYVQSGDPTLDELSLEGLRGLGNMLRYRTAIEPFEPLGVDLESDEIAFFPFLYWPITSQSQPPSAQAYGRLNQFLRTGGLILFDTRDGDLASSGIITPEAEALRAITAGLDIPPLEQLPEDHVLTRTFYLIQDFPGRQAGGRPWVEAAPELESDEDMPFRKLNDGVTPVVIGGNDWAAAWAMDGNGIGLLPMGQGAAGLQQREIAYRFGINLIMHVLTGNYKSDQVHVPALLERLGE